MKRYLYNLLSENQNKVPGIIGGLGVFAHTIFEQILVEQNIKRGAKSEREHPLWIVANASNIPDRIEDLLGKGESCIPWFIKYGKFLESVGVDFLVVPCHTAHAFYASVQPQLKIPWINLIDGTTQFLAENYNSINKIGVLSTDGTLRAQLYQMSLNKVGLTPITLQQDSELQKMVTNTIYDLNWGIKVTGPEVSPVAQNNLRTVVDYLANQGAEIVIAGCTELSIGLDKTEKLALPWLDPLKILANVTLDLAFGLCSLPQNK